MFLQGVCYVISDYASNADTIGVFVVLTAIWLIYKKVQLNITVVNTNIEQRR